ncbi:DUF5018 domain-containing protein [Parapedobacter koreensis]|uniref:DUF5018 domain-containing protein n=1 Tax=Parapedobacter koreensis TaxID=332977 RepID=A0A1H7JS78_9SPHI|nr:hypothetical protein [Parapedobacter koreensis]SEK76667.1 hypothetical protein SAMN05421740_102637 [Parapedobacter koreensis]
MTENKKYIGYTGVVCSLLLLFAVSSCKKTNYEQLKRPYNSIERFSLGGYNELDSINGVISGDEIKVYWSADAERPATIRPNITLSEGAAVSPASGEAVAFSENTVYTVTAEDGTTKEYTLKPIFNEAIPVLSAFDDITSWSWATIDQLKINGEYFLTNNGIADIRIHAQRLRDGYEFDLDMDEELTTGTQLIVDLPKFTTELDSGMHRIWVQVGDFPSNSLDIFIAQPILSNIATSFTLKEAGQTVYLGDTLTLTVNLNPKIDIDQFRKYFTKDNLYRLSVNLLHETINRSIGADFTGTAVIEGNQIKIPFEAQANNPFIAEAARDGYYINRVQPEFIYQVGEYFYGTTTYDTNSGYSNTMRQRSDALAQYTDLDTRKKTVLLESRD